MIKIAVSSHRFLQKIANIPFFKNLFVLKITAINQGSSNTSSELFKFIHTSNSTSKETATNRFSDLDEISAKYIQEGAVVHDVAVSSGITSVELYKKVVGQGKNVNFIVSDRFSEYRVTRGLLNKIIDVDGKVVGFYLFGIFASNELSTKYFISKLLFLIIINIKFIYNSGGQIASDKVLLFCSELNKYIGSGKIECIEYDVFTSEIKNKFDYVRCMNLLNISYFDSSKLSIGIKNILISLRDGGILQVGRTHKDGTNHVSFYVKEKTKIKLLLEVNSGSEINNFIIDVNI